MTTRTTVMEGKITANTTEFSTGMVRVRNEVARATREAEKAAKAQQAATVKLGQESTKAGNAISGATNAIEQFASGGQRSVTNLAKSLAGVGSLLGPSGAIISGAAVAGIALIEMFVKPKREAEELRKSVEETLRQLRVARDGEGLVRRSNQLIVGDSDFRADDGASRLERERARIIQEGGVIKERQRLAKEQAALLREEEQLIAESNQGLVENVGLRAADIAGRRADLNERKKFVEGLREEATALGKAGAEILASDGEREASLERLRKAREAQVAADKDGSKATEQLESALESLESRLDTLAVKGSGPASLSLQLETLFEKVQKNSKASAAQLADLRSKIDTVVSAASADELERLGEELDTFVSQATITAVDDLAIAGAEAAKKLGEMIEVATRAGDLELASQLIEQRDAAVAQNRALQDVTATLEKIEQLRQRASAGSSANAVGVAGINVGTVTSALVELGALQEIERLLENPDLSPKERLKVEEARAKITGQQFDAQKRLAELEAQQAARQKDTLLQAQQYVDVLIAAAAAVGGINSGLVRGLSGLSGVINGLQTITDAAKKVQGFGNLFKTGAGITAAASGVGAIVGGFSVIADTFDLFGNKSKQRARDMQAAAIAWGRALDDFAIRSGSSLEDSLRQNLARAEELYKQAAAATGVNTGGISLQSADDLKRQIDLLNQVITQSGRIAKAFAPFRDELQKLLETVIANEAELKAENEERLALATQDLEVRRLAAAGRTEEAAALGRALQLQRELETARDDETASGLAYVEALRELIDLELAAAAAARVRADVLSTLESDIGVLGLTGVDALTRVIGAIRRLEPELAGLGDGLDLSSREGLETFRTRLRAYYEALAGDGIDELEQPLVQLIQRLLGSIEGALGTLPDAIDPILAALEAFEVRARVFGLSAGARLQGLLPILAEQFGAIADVVAGADLGSTAGLQSLRRVLESIVDGITADGVIDATERALLDAVLPVLDLIETAIDDAARVLEEAAREAETARVARVARSTARTRAAIELGDLSGVDATNTRIAGLAELAPALAGLLEIDLSTIDGLERAKSLLREVFAQIDNGSIAAELLGDLLGPELTDIILDLDGEFDGLIDGLLGVADAARRSAEELSDFAGEVGRDFLRAAGKGLDADLAAIDDRIAKRLARARELGASDATIAQIVAIGQAERDAATQRAAEQAARDAEQQLRDSARAAADPASSTRVTVRSVQSISEVTGQVVAGYLRSIDGNVSTITSMLARTLTGRPPVLSTPALPSSYASVSAGLAPVNGSSMSFGDVIVNVNGAIAGTSPTAIGGEIGREVLLQISSGLGRLAGLQAGGSRR